DRIANRSQWIAQLVGERGQELVLAPVRLAQCVFDLLALDQVRGHPGQEVEIAEGGLRRAMSARKVIVEHADDVAVAPDDRRGLEGANPFLDQDFVSLRLLIVRDLLEVLDDDALSPIFRGIAPSIPSALGEVLDES